MWVCHSNEKRGNPRLIYKRYTIQFLAEVSKVVGVATKFIDMTRDDVLCYLDKCRKPENEDPLHKWTGSYNTKLVIISRFFKWLYYPNIDTPKRRNELSLLDNRIKKEAGKIRITYPITHNMWSM
jgi:hypothetical protein